MKTEEEKKSSDWYKESIKDLKKTRVQSANINDDFSFLKKRFFPWLGC